MNKMSEINGWAVEAYLTQKQIWPKLGKHILAQFDEDSIYVYQAFKPSIADYALANKKFGGPDFELERMTWIKTNFLWMMYRSGWASKKNQERILAIRISKNAFHDILSKARTAQFDKDNRLGKKDLEVRLQWDPDHGPRYEKKHRRAIQLGLKGEMLRRYSEEFIIDIIDITDFVREQQRILETEGIENLLVARERVYEITDQTIATRIELYNEES